MENYPEIYDEAILLTGDKQQRYYPGNVVSQTDEFIDMIGRQQMDKLPQGWNVTEFSEVPCWR